VARTTTSYVTRRHPEILYHIKILIPYGYKDREIAEMVSRVNGVEISHNLVWRTRWKEGENKLLEMISNKRLFKCSECGERLFEIADGDDPDRVICSLCGLVVEEKDGFTVPLGDQMTQMTPGSHLNFKLLGTPTRESILIHAVVNSNPQF